MEKERLEQERKKENMDKLRKDMEKSKGETVVLSTGLKGKEARNKNMMVEDEDDDEAEYLDDDDEIVGDEEDMVDEDEDEEVSRFSF